MPETPKDKSVFEIIREVFIYAPLGAIGFVKDNAPMLLSLVVSRGKSDVAHSSKEQPQTTVVNPNAGFIERKKPLAKSGFDDMTSDIRRAKDLLYSVVGATGFIKKNAGTIRPLIDTQGKKTVDSKVATGVDKAKSIKPRTKDRLDEDLVSSESNPEKSTDIKDSDSTNNMIDNVTATISSAISMPFSMMSGLISSVTKSNDDS